MALMSNLISASEMVDIFAEMWRDDSEEGGIKGSKKWLKKVESIAYKYGRTLKTRDVGHLWLKNVEGREITVKANVSQSKINSQKNSPGGLCGWRMLKERKSLSKRKYHKAIKKNFAAEKKWKRAIIYI